MPSESGGEGNRTKPPGKHDAPHPQEVIKPLREPDKERIVKPPESFRDKSPTDPAKNIDLIGGSPEDSLRQIKKIEQLQQKPKLRIEAVSLPSDKHPKRNEDKFFKLSKKGAFGILDGAGGLDKGDIASGLARDSAIKSIEAIPDDATLKEAISYMRGAIIEANRIVFTQAQKGGTKMASTMTLCLIWEGKAIVASVGDSRAYRFRDGKLELITLDDTHWVKEEAKGDKQRERAIHEILDSVETEQDLWKLPDDLQILYLNRSLLSQAIGAQETINPNIYLGDAQEGDKFLLTTDGMSNLTRKKTEEIMAESSNGKIAVERLTEKARRKSREKDKSRRADDITALLAEILTSEQADEEAKRLAYELGAFNQLKKHVLEGRPLGSITEAGGLREVLRGSIMADKNQEVYSASEDVLEDAYRAAFEQLKDDVRSGEEDIGSITRTGDLRNIVKADIDREHSIEQQKTEMEQQSTLKKVTGAAKENVSGFLYSVLGEKSPAFIKRHVSVYRFVEKIYAGMANESGFSEWHIGGRGTEQRRRVTEWVDNHIDDPYEFVAIKSHLGDLEKSGAVEIREWGGGLKKVVLKHRDPGKIIKHEVIKSNRDPAK